MGTGFLIERNGKQYLVTAKHVLIGIHEGEELHLSYKGEWISSNPIVIGHGKDGIDVSVLALEKPLVRGEGVVWDEKDKKPHDVGGFMYGQEVYFLGFPFGLFTNAGELNAHFPMPLVKRAIISGELAGDVSGVYLLDGINNPSFSGGPVVYRNPVVPTSKLYVMSVVSGYLPHDATVKYDGKKTPFLVEENTGIVISYSIRHALDLIDANPKGAPL